MNKLIASILVTICSAVVLPAVCGCRCIIVGCDYSVPEAEYGIAQEDASDLHRICTILTLGLIPYWDTFKTEVSVAVATPIGSRTGYCECFRREVVGLAPYLLPFGTLRMGWAAKLEGAPEEYGAVEELEKRLVAECLAGWTGDALAELNAAGAEEAARGAAQSPSASR
ncbi:MAG: hypothetical protein K6F50_10415 [Kiritimatiellae bacterium]|nr:hypothetical protein [Kiritimatiellia bacterium]